MADITIPAYMDTAVVATQVKGTMLMLSGTTNEGRPIVKPCTGGTVEAVGVLKEDWNITGDARLEVNLAGTATLKREIAILSWKNPLVPVLMKTGATTVVPGDYIMTDAAGLADKWVTGSSNLKQGRVMILGTLAGAAGDLVFMEPLTQLGAIA